MVTQVNENGSYVGMRMGMCPVCGKVEPTGEILLHQRMKKVFPENGKMEPDCYNLCEEHKDLYEKGFIALVGVDEEKSKSNNGKMDTKDAYRTGVFVHVHSSKWTAIFQREAPKDKDGKLRHLVFVSDAIIQQLIKLKEKLDN